MRFDEIGNHATNTYIFETHLPLKSVMLWKNFNCNWL